MGTLCTICQFLAEAYPDRHAPALCPSLYSRLESGLDYSVATGLGQKKCGVAYTGWSKIAVPQFYFCDNFRKCTLILIIFFTVRS